MKKNSMDYSIKIGGEAGQGIQTIGDTLARVFSRSGYFVFTHQDYESRVRGGHNFYQIRVSDKPVMASRDPINIIVAFDKESILFHEAELAEEGLLIYDSAAFNQRYENPHFLDVPFSGLAVERGGSKIMANTVATGAVLGMLKMNIDLLSGIIRDTFQKKGEEIVRSNINAAAAGHEFAVKNCRGCSFFPSVLSEPRMLLAGIDAIALGAIASGCKFYSAYPMTPSTGIMNYIAGKEKEYGIIVEQAEDEIAAINMALGASFAGVRSMTGTAGGGFALMAEGLSLAGMTETPVVIALGQRPAPATGLPTRTEQGDLLFALHAAHGEFPRIIYAPGTPEQAFYLTNKAFDMTGKFQVPAFVIFDQYLADSMWTTDGFDLSKVLLNDYRLKDEEFSKNSEYKRYAFTDTGVSPMGVPGDAARLVVVDSDEHDEEGHIIEDPETRVKMMDKRLHRKLPLIRKNMQPPLIYGSSDPEILIAGWGSVFGVMREAIDVLSQSGNASMLHFSEIYPLPSTEDFDYMKVLKNARLSICVENNATGQFARLIRAETGFEFKAKILKFDGRPFTLESLLGEINAHLG